MMHFIKNLTLNLLIVMIAQYLAACSGPMTQLKMQEPDEGKAILVGAILVENNGIDDLYEATTANIIAVIVGRHIENGQEVIQAYRLQTDANGYFYLPNVPQGSYVLKGIEVDVGFTGKLLISSRWDGPKQIYIPAGLIIDHVVRHWPEEVHKQVIDLNITYIMVDLSQRIYSDEFISLEENVLALKGVSHTMQNPKIYYRERYPEINCFQE